MVDGARGCSNNPERRKINLEWRPRPPPRFGLPVTTFLVSTSVQFILNSFPLLFFFVGLIRSCASFAFHKLHSNTTIRDLAFPCPPSSGFHTEPLHGTVGTGWLPWPWSDLVLCLYLRRLSVQWLGVPSLPEHDCQPVGLLCPPPHTELLGYLLPQEVQDPWRLLQQPPAPDVGCVSHSLPEAPETCLPERI